MRARAFPFHDGNLVSVSVHEHVAVLGLKQATGETFVMTLGGVEALRIDGFLQGNIILSLWAVGGGAPTNEDAPLLDIAAGMAALFPGPHPEAAARYHEAHAQFLAKKFESVRTGAASLVLIVPAYGAQLFAFCADIDLQPPMAAHPRT